MFLHILRTDAFYIKNPVDDDLITIEQFEKFKMTSKMAARIRKTLLFMEIHGILF